MKKRLEEYEDLLARIHSTGSRAKAIVDQQHDKHSQFIYQETLPQICKNATREQLETLGIMFGDPVDNLFIYVVLPDGWDKIGGDNRYDDWTYLVDAQERLRASILYKDAFYGLNPRYSCHLKLVHGYSDNRRENDSHVYIAKDNGHELWRTEIYKKRPNGIVVEQGCHQWLDEHYPEWRNPLMYWNNEPVA